MSVWSIIQEAIDDPSGLIHPEKHQAFAQGKHPLAKHPAYPAHAPGQRTSNYEEVLASRQWQKILQKAHQYLGVPLTAQALPTIQQKLLGAMQLIDQAESQYKEELEALAVELVFELPEYKSAQRSHEEGSFQIDAQIADEIDLSGTMTSDEPEAKAPLHQERTPAEQEWMQKMIQRRHFTNAMIQGSAVSNNYLFELAGQRLDQINPKLRKAYGILMVSSEIGYWMFPQSAVIAGARAQTQVGSAQVTFVGGDEEEGEDQPEVPGERERPPQQKIPVVKARGMTFPVLIQEIIKGLTELASLPSLPRDPVDREEVLNKADLVDTEAWHMMLGPKLWDSFIEATDATDERDLTMHLYRHIQELDVDEFNGFMKEVLSKSPRGMQMLRDLAAQIKAELGNDGDVAEASMIVRAILDD
jgi:hypothetical protein